MLEGNLVVYAVCFMYKETFQKVSWRVAINIYFDLQCK